MPLPRLTPAQPPPPSRPSGPGRRRLRTALLTALITVPVLLSGCAQQDDGGISDAELARAEIPARPSPDTTITVGSPEDRVLFELSGESEKLPFEVKWANISGGPQCSEAFRAHSLDLCASAEVPAVHARWTGLSTKLVAAEERRDPQRNPIYRLGVAPGADIDALKDLKGKRIAFSPGQAQGALVLRILARAGLDRSDVKLVEMPSTGDVYSTALGERQVDAAPLGAVNLKRYPAKYGKEGGKTIPHGIRDDASHLWAPTESVADPRKAAAVREFVKAWYRVQVWAWEHRDEWVEGFAVEDQGLSRADGVYLHKHNGAPEIPADWDGVIARHQKTIDLLARETGQEKFDAATLYDRRFEHLGAKAPRPGGSADGGKDEAAGEEKP